MTSGSDYLQPVHSKGFFHFAALHIDSVQAVGTTVAVIGVHTVKYLVSGDSGLTGAQHDTEHALL